MILPLVNMTCQRHEADCGVAVLAMFLHVSYEDALLALGSENPDVLRNGAWVSQMQRAAALFGVTLKRKAKWTDEDEGIAQIKLRGPVNHFVLLREGLVFNTNGTVWYPDDYLRAKRGQAGNVLVNASEDA